MPGDDSAQMLGHRRIQRAQFLLLLPRLLYLAQHQITNRKIVIELRVFRIEADRLLM